MKKLLSLFTAVTMLTAVFTTALPVSATVEPVVLSASETTVIEFENYKDAVPGIEQINAETQASSVYYPTVSDSDGASGGKYLVFDSVDNQSANDYYEFTIPISVPRTESYMMELITSANASVTTLFLGDSETGTDITPTNITRDSSKNEDGRYTHFNSTWSQADIATMPIILPEGEQIITFRLAKREEHGDIALLLDCISFTAISIPISEESNVIEFEKYTSFFSLENNTASNKPSVLESENASDGKYLYIDTSAGVGPASMSFSLDVENTYYSEIALIQNPQQSAFTVSLDDKVILTHSTSATTLDPSRDEETGLYPYFGQKWYPAKEYKTIVKLEEGVHTLSFKWERRTTTDNDLALCADYISFAPATDLPTVNLNDTTRVEFEDYSSANVVSNLDYASGNKLVNASYSTTAPVISVPLIVEKSGYYDISYLAGNYMLHNSPKYLSQVNFYLDDSLFASTSDAYAENLKDTYPIMNDVLPVCRYEYDRVWLEKGTHTVDVEILITADERYKFTLDYIEFAPSEDKIINKQGYVTAEAFYDEAISGTPVIALYQGKKLVAVDTGVIEETVATFETYTESSFDSAKIFVLDSLTGLAPMHTEKTITTIEEKDINVFLLGDSVCVNYGESSYPQQGWGFYFHQFFADNISVINKAKGGASTKTYKSLGLWDEVQPLIEKGDYVFINFGLNDFYNISEDGKGTTIEQYEANLTEYCNVITAKGATPILVSTIPEMKENYTSLQARAASKKNVADALDVTFLDLNTYLNNLWVFDDEGNYSETKVTDTFNYYYLSEEAFNRIEEECGTTVPENRWEYIANTPDRTHINIDGAYFVASTIASLLSESDCPLANALIEAN